MLALIGLGLDGTEISAKGLSYVAGSDEVFAEFYTSLPCGDMAEIERIIGKPITVLAREDVEERELPLERARTGTVAFLVMGDPLVATTHISLAARAREEGIPLVICHASSIYSAIGSTGLMLYKFGKSASIVYPERNYFPKSFYETIVQNKERGLHTLLFLDLKADKDIYMDPVDGMRILRAADEGTIVSTIIVASRIGWKSEKIVYGEVSELSSLDASFFGPPPHCIVVPGDLHFAEEEYVELFRYR
jgi:diphthine synthase